MNRALLASLAVNAALAAAVATTGVMLHQVEDRLQHIEEAVAKPVVGPRGPQGPAGPQGLEGPEGPEGPAGADGRNGTDGAACDLGWPRLMRVVTDVQWHGYDDSSPLSVNTDTIEVCPFP